MCRSHGLVPQRYFTQTALTYCGETLFHLLDLYTQHRSTTIVGCGHNLDTFLGIHIILNLEKSANKYPLYAQSMTEKASSNDYESAPRSAIKLRENTTQEPRCQQLAASANSRIKHLQFENCMVGVHARPSACKK